MVIFQTPDGNPGYNQFETLDEAVRFVEKLRNEQSVETARMFALEEVKFDFKPYYRVQLDPPAVGAGAAPAAEIPSSNGPSFAPPAEPANPPVSFGEPPAPPAGAPISDADSPVGGEPATVGAPPPPTFMAPPGPAPTEEQQTTRRGLFGR